VIVAPTIGEMARGVAAALEDEAKWCTGAFAKDGNGFSVGATSPRACKWCAEGHANRLYGENRFALINAYAKHFNRESVAGDNDDREERGRLYVRDRLLELAAFHEANHD